MGLGDTRPGVPGFGYGMLKCTASASCCKGSSAKVSWGSSVERLSGTAFFMMLQRFVKLGVMAQLTD